MGSHLWVISKVVQEANHADKGKMFSLALCEAERLTYMLELSINVQHGGSCASSSSWLSKMVGKIDRLASLRLATSSGKCTSSFCISDRTRSDEFLNLGGVFIGVVAGSEAVTGSDGFFVDEFR